MKIFSADQIRQADRYTIENEPIPSIELMERASRAFVQWFAHRFDKNYAVAVVCGTGNNGGDGLAVARLLIGKGYRVTPWVVKFGGKGSDDFRNNHHRLSTLTSIRDLGAPDDLTLDRDAPDVIIDAIFGSGLTRPVEGPYAEVVHKINDSDALIVAIDIPSGLFCDSHSSGKAIVKADHVVSFQLPKLAFFMPENAEYVGQWSVVDIGLSRKFIRDEPCQTRMLRRSAVRKRVRTRSRFDHKGTFGRALIVSGSYGKMGAAVLCARACQRAGAGLTTVHVPTAGYDIVQTAVPEAMVSPDVGTRFITGISNIDRYDAIGVGPGIDTHMDTVVALERLLTNHRGGLVMDADALNILSQHPHLREKLPEGAILTPHPGEFKRLVGPWGDDFEKLERLRELSKSTGACIVLKGYHSAVALPDGSVFFNTTGNPGMATGGSGDVLTGMLTGLLAQGYTAVDAALTGVYLHGLAGDYARDQVGEEALIASDIIDHICTAYRQLKG